MPTASSQPISTTRCWTGSWHSAALYPDLGIDRRLLAASLAPDQAADVFEVIEDRVGLRSTIVTSQLPVAMWHDALGEPTVADGILDRLLEHVHRIELRGESLRRQATPSDDPSDKPRRHS